MNLKDLLNDGMWKDVLANEFEQPYFKALEQTLQREYDQGKQIYPPRDLIFNALNLTTLETVKVVILGQDPYPSYGKAMGLSYSVQYGVTVPQSLRNMYIVLERDSGIIPKFKRPNHGCLEDWAMNGVLMLNATLTVGANQANSHANFGWQTFTDAIIKDVSDHCDHVVFILMGVYAKEKEILINPSKHKIIMTDHPAYFPFKFFLNYNFFSECNYALENDFKLTPVNWNLPLLHKISLFAILLILTVIYVTTFYIRP